MLFVFNKSTACEMRISDWISDVCSSDLPAEEAARAESWLYEGRDQRGVDAHEILRWFIDRTDRILQLIDTFVPECAWLDDSGTLTYLHATVSTNDRTCVV